MKRLWIAGIALALLLAPLGCAPERTATPTQPRPDATPATPTDTPGGEPEPAAPAFAWLDTQLTDAVTGEQFRLTDFRGKPVLLHAFAVW